MAYENTIIQAYQQFNGDGWRQYNRAFRIQDTTRRTTDWTSADPSLDAHLVACQSRHASTCQFCCTSSHRSTACSWGVDKPSAEEISPSPSLRRATTTRGDPPVCISWNAGACKFSGSCAYRHVCASCGVAEHHSTKCCQSQHSQGDSGCPRQRRACYHHPGWLRQRPPGLPAWHPSIVRLA